MNMRTRAVWGALLSCSVIPGLEALVLFGAMNLIVLIIPLGREVQYPYNILFIALNYLFIALIYIGPVIPIIAAVWGAVLGVECRDVKSGASFGASAGLLSGLALATLASQDMTTGFWVVASLGLVGLLHSASVVWVLNRLVRPRRSKWL